MPRWKLALVVALAVTLITWHGYDIITRTEQWPISYYPMYGRAVKKSELKLLALFGEFKHKNNKLRTERIIDASFVPPLGEVRLRNILMRAWGRDGSTFGAIDATAAVLRDYMSLYESRRKLNLHRGPEMNEIRLYRLTWKLPRPVDDQEPKRAELLMTVQPDGSVILPQAATKPTTDESPDE